MACFHPLQAYQCKGGDVVFTDNLRRNDVIRSLQLPCGRCSGCRLERSRQWATRCIHEKQQHQLSCYLTLTYDDAHLPNGSTLVYRHFQLFLKKLRKYHAKNNTNKLKFYMCGEYGEERQRPHYHMILYGLHFTDQTHYKNNERGEPLNNSPTLDKLWGHGQCLIGEVTFESAAYVARYIMKKQTGDEAYKTYQNVNLETGEIINRQPEFNQMSRRTGIGKEWLTKYSADLIHGFVIINGVKTTIPRYYMKQLRKTHPLHVEQIDLKRHKEAALRHKDNTDERLKVREAYHAAQLERLQRTLK